MEYSQGGKKMVGAEALNTYLDKFDRKYWATYKASLILSLSLPVSPFTSAQPPHQGK